MDQRPVLAYITIAKTTSGTYTCDPYTPTFNFSITSLRVKPPMDSQGGDFELTITSNDATNSAMNTILANIEEGNEVTIWLGKTNATKTKCFLGVIETIEIDEVNPNLMYISLSGPDWGSNLLKHRVIFGSRIQKKLLSDQTQLDNTDDNALASNIVTSVLSNEEWYPDTVYPLPCTDFGLVVDASNITISPIHISQFEANFERIGDKFSEIDDMTDSRHYVDPDKNFIMQPRTTVSPSGLLLTDSPNSALAVGWDQTKVGHILPGAKVKRTVENHRRRLFGLGANEISIDQQQTTVSTYTAMNSNWIAQQFTPTKKDCYNIALYLGSTGTPTVDMTLFLQEDSGGLPGGSTIRSLNISKNQITASGAWVYLPISETLIVGNNYWLVLSKAGDGSNTYRWYRDTTDHSPTKSATSANGSSWTATSTPNRFSYAFIEYDESPLTVISPTGAQATQKHFWEDVIHRPDINQRASMNNFILGTFASASKRKEILDIKIRSPDIIPKTGDLVMVDMQNSPYVINTQTYTVTNIEYVFQTNEDEQTGQYHFNVTLSRPVAYT